MAYTIQKNYVNKSKYSIKCPYAMRPTSITVHNTDNDASAENEIAYMRRNNSQVSFHVAIDDKNVIYGIPLNRNAWHAGDGGKGRGNRSSIGVEICYSKSGGKKFDEAEKNAAKWIAKELKTRKWGIERVKRHKDWSGKNCPKRTMLKGWQRFLDMIKAEMQGNVSKPVLKPSSNKLKVDGYFGTATVKATQILLKTSVDGIVSRQPNVNKKYLVRAVDGVWKFTDNYKGGSLMVKALQKKVGATADGYMGTATVKALQKYLINKGYTLKADGYMGTATVKAWQEYLNKSL